MKILAKIDRFYIALVTLLLIMAVISIALLRGVFSALETSGEIDDSLLSASTPRINKDKLVEVVEKINTKEFIPLDL